MIKLSDILNLNSTVFLTLAAVGLTIAVVIEQAQLIAKHQGAKNEKVAGGYNIAMKIMVLNRVGTVLYFLFIAISVDMGTTVSTISHYFIGSVTAVAVINIIITASFWRHNKLRGPLIVSGDLPIWPFIAAFVATLFGLLGLTLPILMSAAIPELRLTLANTGFVFNSIFTLINVFFVESYVAQLIDDKDHRLGRFVVIVFLSRIVSAVTCVGLLLVVESVSIGQ